MICPPRLPRCCCCPAPAHDPAAAQIGQQFRLEHAHFFKSGRLNEQSFVDCRTGYVHGRVSGIPGLQPPGDLLWRPLPRQLSGNQFAKARVECQLAGLGTAGTIQRPFISPSRSIDPAPAIPGNFTADRGSGSPQMSAKLPERAPFNETARGLLSLHPADRPGPAAPEQRLFRRRRPRVRCAPGIALGCNRRRDRRDSK